MNFYPLINRKKVHIKNFPDESIVYIDELNIKKINLNKSAKFIFDKCDGKNSVQDIISLYEHTYRIKDNSHLIAKKDVYDVLVKLDSFGIIAWRNRKNPFIKSRKIKNLEIFKVGLNNKYLIKSNFKNLMFSAGIDKNTIYNTQLIITGINSGLMNIYFIKKDGRDCACILINMAESCLVWHVMAILYNDNFNMREDSLNIFENIISDLEENVYKRTAQFGFYINVQNVSINNCELLGFKKQGCLKYESDTEIFSMWYIKG